jgi:hypothetical protein
MADDNAAAVAELEEPAAKKSKKKGKKKAKKKATTGRARGAAGRVAYLRDWEDRGPDLERHQLGSDLSSGTHRSQCECFVRAWLGARIAQASCVGLL